MQLLSDLLPLYGGAAFPIPNDDTLQSLIIDDLLGIDSDIDASSLAIVADPELTVVSRADVGQGPLARVSSLIHSYTCLWCIYISVMQLHNYT